MILRYRRLLFSFIPKRFLASSGRQLLFLLIPLFIIISLSLIIMNFFSINILEIFLPIDKTSFQIPLLVDRIEDNFPKVELYECAENFFKSNFERSIKEVSTKERESANLKDIGIDHVYIIHYTPLRYRRGNLTEMLKIHGIIGEWVTGFDKEVLNTSTDECFHYFNPKQLKGIKSNRYNMTGLFPKPLGPSQRSVVIKHFSALYDAYRYNYKNILIFEDDVLLRAGFIKRLGEVLNETPSGFDAIFIGGCMRFYAWRRKMQTELITKHIYRKQLSRCAHAFILSQSGVRKLLRSLPLTEAIDFQMNLAIKEENMTVYWVEPWLSVQGHFGENTCVTMTDIKGAGSCKFSTTQHYSPSFDIRLVNEKNVIDRWETVPPFRHAR